MKGKYITTQIRIVCQGNRSKRRASLALQLGLNSHPDSRVIWSSPANPTVEKRKSLIF